MVSLITNKTDGWVACLELKSYCEKLLNEEKKNEGQSIPGKE